MVCGGGLLNKYLLSRIQAGTSGEVIASESAGIDGDSLEAAAFAWFAYRRMNRLSANEPAVTGAHGYRVLGAVYPGG